MSTTPFARLWDAQRHEEFKRLYDIKEGALLNNATAVSDFSTDNIYPDGPNLEDLKTLVEGPQNRTANIAGPLLPISEADTIAKLAGLHVGEEVDSRAVIKRICLAVQEKKWSPQLLYTAFNDIDAVFLNGRLKGRVHLVMIQDSKDYVVLLNGETNKVEMENPSPRAVITLKVNTRADVDTKFPDYVQFLWSALLENMVAAYFLVTTRELRYRTRQTNSYTDNFLKCVKVIRQPIFVMLGIDITIAAKRYYNEEYYIPAIWEKYDRSKAVIPLHPQLLNSGVEDYLQEHPWAKNLRWQAILLAAGRDKK